MEAATARPLHSTPAPHLVPADHAHDAITRAMNAERDNRSLTLRNRQLLRAAEGTAKLTPVMTVGANAGLLELARSLERMGRVPAIRFARDKDNQITGLELAMIERTEADVADEDVAGTIGLAAEFGEMEVGA